MREVIKTVFVNYITCAIVGGILEYVVPNKMKKTMRVVVVSVMLGASFSPLLKTDFDFSNITYPAITAEEISYDALMHTANLTEKKIHSQMKEILIKESIDEYEIYVRTSIEKEENTVYLDEIKIEIPTEFKDKVPNIKKAVPEEYQGVFTIGQIGAESENERDF